MQTTCISCNDMYRQGTSLEKAVSYQICDDPTIDLSSQEPEGNQDLAQTDQEAEKKLYLDNWEENFIEWIWAEGWIYGAAVLGFFLAFNLFLCIVFVKCCNCRYKNGRQKASMEGRNDVNDSSRRPLQHGDKSDAQTPALFNTIELCDAECQTDKGKFQFTLNLDAVMENDVRYTSSENGSSERSLPFFGPHKFKKQAQ